MTFWNRKPNEPDHWNKRPIVYDTNDDTNDDDKEEDDI
jgi:hypothetical protein